MPIKPEEWEAINQLIADAKQDEGLRNLLRLGSQEAKKEVLTEYGLEEGRLRQIHLDLEAIFYKGSFPFWWW